MHHFDTHFDLNMTPGELFGSASLSIISLSFHFYLMRHVSSRTAAA
jgi:hypothetical protein